MGMTPTEAQKKRAAEATHSRESGLNVWMKNQRIQIVIAIVIAIVLVTLVFFVPMWQIGGILLLIAIALPKKSSAFKDVIGHWRTILYILGITMIGGSILLSNVPRVFSHAVESTDRALGSMIDGDKSEKTARQQQVRAYTSVPAKTPKAAVVTPCTGVYAGKELCRVVDLAHNGARHTLPYIPAEKCWVLWVPFDGALGFEKVPDGTEVWAKSRDITAQLFVMNVGEPAFIDPRNGHQYVCP